MTDPQIRPNPYALRAFCKELTPGAEHGFCPFGILNRTAGPLSVIHHGAVWRFTLEESRLNREGAGRYVWSGSQKVPQYSGRSTRRD